MHKCLENKLFMNAETAACSRQNKNAGWKCPLTGCNVTLSCSDWTSEDSGSGWPVSFDSPASQINKLWRVTWVFMLTPVMQLEILICLLWNCPSRAPSKSLGQTNTLFPPVNCETHEWTEICPTQQKSAKHTTSFNVGGHFHVNWGLIHNIQSKLSSLYF